MPEIKNIRILLADGKLEEAFSATIAALENRQDCQDLLEAARGNQSTFSQARVDWLNGTISEDAYLREKSRHTQSLLNILSKAENGERLVQGQSKDLVSPWRYYLAGGLVALTIGLLVWNYFFREKTDANGCPTFAQTTKFKVMLLPFLQTSNQAGPKMEYEIMDYINDLAERAELLAEVKLNAKYDIEAAYPSPPSAEELGLGCENNMVVWGRVDRNADGQIRLDVRYRLVNAKNNPVSAGEEELGSLLISPSEGSMYRDPESISKYLFAEIANAMNKPKIALALWNGLLANATNAPTKGNTDPAALENSTDTSFAPVISDPNKGTTGNSGSAGNTNKTGNTSTTSTSTPKPTTAVMADTALILTRARSLWMAKQYDKAILEYDKIIAVDPSNREALQNRGVLHYQNKTYEKAARDLESALVHPMESDIPVLKYQTEAYIQTNQLDKAEKTMRTIKGLKPTEGPGAWMLEKETVLKDKKLLAEKDRKAAEKSALTTKTVTSRLKAAKLNLDLGNNAKASIAADQILATQPTNMEAVKIKIETQLSSGDTAGVRKTIQTAINKGLRAKDVIEWKPSVAPLVAPRVQ